MSSLLRPTCFRCAEYHSTAGRDEPLRLTSPSEGNPLQTTAAAIVHGRPTNIGRAVDVEVGLRQNADVGLEEAPAWDHGRFADVVPGEDSGVEDSNQSARPMGNTASYTNSPNRAVQNPVQNRPKTRQGTPIWPR